jgi:hypothetical protein
LSPRRRPRLSPPVLLTFALALGACQTPNGETTASGNLIAADGQAWHGQQSKAVERAQLLARTAQEWEALWARVGEPAPQALPTGRMAAALFLGTRDTAGFGVTIDSARTKDGTIIVSYHEQIPGPSQTVAMVQTSPYAVRLLPLREGNVVFERMN